MSVETDLYAPVKAYLEARGYDVKAEVKGCDIVAYKDDPHPVVVELKLTFSLDLVLQGIDRLTVSDDVYLAFARPNTPAKRRNWRAKRRKTITLCRRLGLGLMVVDLERSTGEPVEVLADPAPYTPRPNKKRQISLKQEFTRRQGDPNVGGTTRRIIMTAYRQDALRCLRAIDADESLSIREIANRADCPKAASILQKNHYGWFTRVERGVYQASETGRSALRDFAKEAV